MYMCMHMCMCMHMSLCMYGRLQPRVPRLQPYVWQAELVRAEGYTRWRKGVALLAAALLGVTYLLYFCLFVSLGEPYFTNHRTCEFQQLACTTRGALYRCADARSRPSNTRPFCSVFCSLLE